MTNKEIAKQLGISPASLSLIINHKPGVSENTRGKVLEQLRELGYDHLIKKEPAAVLTNNLCYLIFRCGEISDPQPYFLLLMEAIENRAREYGYNIFLYTLNKKEPLGPQLQQITELQCQGIVVYAVEMQEEDISILSSLSIPFVLMENTFARLDCTTVNINAQMGCYQAIEYLVRTGHRKIGYLQSNMPFRTFKERYQHYLQVLDHFGLSFAPEHIWPFHYLEEGTYHEVLNYLSHSSKELPEAFVCDDDIIALGAMRAFQEKGYRIPEDVSILGFANRPPCKLSNPLLTTINSFPEYVAAAAIDELYRLIQDKKTGAPKRPANKILVSTELIIRDSVADRNLNN